MASSEQGVRLDAVLGALRGQRNEALDQAVSLRAELSTKDARLQELEKALAAKDARLQELEAEVARLREDHGTVASS